MMVKVSVVIPTYKGSAGIQRSLDSLYEQTFSDIEIIVVDDNGEGTEEQLKTEQVLQTYIQRGKLTYVVQPENKGGSVARNAGAKVAVGKYLMFLDDDDAISKDNIEKQISLMERQRADVAFSYSSSRIYSDGVVSNTIYAKESGRLLYPYLKGDVFIGTGTYVMRYSVWEELGGYDESFVRHQDWEFLARILDRYNAVAIEDVFFERYITNRNLPQNIQKAEEYSDHFIGFLKKSIKSLNNKELRNIINLNSSRIAVKYLKTGQMKEFFRVMRKYDTVYSAYKSLLGLILRQIMNYAFGKRS